MWTLVFTPRSVYIYEVAKSFGFAFDKKRKSKTKRFCLVRSWKSVGFLRRTNHRAETLALLLKFTWQRVCRKILRVRQIPFLSFLQNCPRKRCS